MLTHRQMTQIGKYRRKRYKTHEIARLVGISEQVLLDYIGELKLKQEKGGESREQDPTPEEIEAAIAPLREAQKRNPRYDGNAREPLERRMPRHYCQMPKL